MKDASRILSDFNQSIDVKCLTLLKSFSNVFHFFQVQCFCWKISEWNQVRRHHSDKFDENVQQKGTTTLSKQILEDKRRTMGGSRSLEVAVAPQWSRLQKQIAGSAGDGKSVKGRWRSGRPIFEQGPHSRNSDCSSRSRRYLSEGRDPSGIGPCEDLVLGDKSHFTNTVAEAKKKVFRLEKALEAFGETTGTEVDFLKKALAKAQEVAWERPLEVHQGVSRSSLEADRQAEMALLTEGITTRKSTIGSVSATARTGSDRVAAAPVLQKPVWCAVGCPPLDNIPPVPDDIQDVEEWLICRNCKLRNALEFGNPTPWRFWANWWRKEFPS